MIKYRFYIFNFWDVFYDDDKFIFIIMVDGVIGLKSRVDMFCCFN